MKSRITAALAVAVSLCGLFVARAEAALPAGVQKVMTRYKIPSEAVSVLVQDVDADTPTLALNIDTPRNPASTAKVVTTWTALDMFGPTYTWPTRVYRSGALSNGVLHGNLILKGFGDPYLVLEDFWSLLGQIRRAGIRDIEGDLVLDATAFQVDDSDPGAFDGQGDRLYNVLPSALMVNFKSIDFIFDADSKSGRVNITTSPALANLTITNHIKLTSAPCRGNALNVYMRPPPPNAPEQVEFGGEMPASCRHFQLSRSILTPAAYTFGVFKSLWGQWGGTIKGGYQSATQSAKAVPVLTWQSRPLGELMRPLNKWSNNLMARMLLFAIGAREGHWPVTRAQGEAALLTHLAGRGLDTQGIVLDNGSGLSRTTRVSARFMAALLRHAWHQPTMPEFVSSLSIVGIDGTTRRRFHGAPERGRMHLKTGSLQNVSAVTGYVHAQNGHVYVVNVMINYANANYGVGTAVQDAVLSWTYRLP